MFSLTIEGAHRLFGYDLGGIREYDLRLNGRRTHIVESYAFERDLLADVPLELAPSEAFTLDGTLREFVRSWQRDVAVFAVPHSPGTYRAFSAGEQLVGVRYSNSREKWTRDDALAHNHNRSGFKSGRGGS